VNKNTYSCPTCRSLDVVKNGFTRHGKQNHKCCACGRQFSGRNTVLAEPLTEPVLLERLMQERLSMRAIARILCLSLGMAYNRIMDVLHPFGDMFELVQEADYEHFSTLNIEVDELWTFVDAKKNKTWVWLARCRETKQFVGLAVGDRSAQTGQVLWASMPESIRIKSHFFSDYWEAYTTFIPKEQHTQGKAHTPFIERSNNALRQRIGRLVRKTCSFSRCIVNLENQIKFFIFHYNKKYNFLLKPTTS
jgi:IS1 family transposase/transposase-like protein